MKILIIYDSYYGNTEKIARLYRKLLNAYQPKFVYVSDATQEMIDAAELLILATPVRVFNMSAKMLRFVRRREFEGKYFFAIDTRIKIDKQGKFLKRMINKFGYATDKIEDKLSKAKATKIMDSKWYYCNDAEGPLEVNYEEIVKKDVEELIKQIKI